MADPLSLKRRAYTYEAHDLRKSIPEVTNQFIFLGPYIFTFGEHAIDMQNKVGKCRSSPEILVFMLFEIN